MLLDVFPGTSSKCLQHLHAELDFFQQELKANHTGAKSKTQKTKQQQ